MISLTAIIKNSKHMNCRRSARICFSESVPLVSLSFHVENKTFSVCVLVIDKKNPALVVIEYKVL